MSSCVLLRAYEIYSQSGCGSGSIHSSPLATLPTFTNRTQQHSTTNTTQISQFTRLSNAEMSNPSTVPTGARRLYKFSKLTAKKKATQNVVSLLFSRDRNPYQQWPSTWLCVAKSHSPQNKALAEHHRHTRNGGCAREEGS